MPFGQGVEDGLGFDAPLFLGSTSMPQIDSLYDILDWLSTASRTSVCNDLIRRPQKLVDLFLESRADRLDYANVDQPFIDPISLQNRTPITAESTGTNYVVYLLQQQPPLIKDESGDQLGYSFQYAEREVPPLRITDAGLPSSGGGGIDYIAHRTDSPNPAPILGEIKRHDDKDAFYAFVQLLTYLSSMGTPSQIARANEHSTFGAAIGDSPRFDLHILLADFNDRGERGPLIELTHQLASLFRQKLESQIEYPDVLGEIMCLKMDTAHYAEAEVKSLSLIWRS